MDLNALARVGRKRIIRRRRFLKIEKRYFLKFISFSWRQVSCFFFLFSALARRVLDFLTSVFLRYRLFLHIKKSVRLDPTTIFRVVTSFALENALRVDPSKG
jgi:hypothetical protein